MTANWPAAQCDVATIDFGICTGTVSLVSPAFILAPMFSRWSSLVFIQNEWKLRLWCYM